MSNIIRLSETASEGEWLSMSNQGTDCFLDLLICAADAFGQTEHQERLISFLKDQRSVNDIAPGTAGFDVTEMPWYRKTLPEDARFLTNVIETANLESTFDKLPYEADRETVLPWLDTFAGMIARLSADPELQAEIGGILSGKVREFIDEHSFCSEYLFRDWESFIDLLYSEGGRISSILWWDHCRKTELRFSVGSGGYTDPEDPEYVYAETQLWKDDLETKTPEEIKEYIAAERKTGFNYGNKYRSHDLVPSFYLDI
ncbi:MAG: hypothetical protein IKE18_09070 [Oscillospiraceae bacterium]|nr:hypothetical protein [Oscillospiraceae bacterium]